MSRPNSGRREKRPASRNDRPTPLRGGPPSTARGGSPSIERGGSPDPPREGRRRGGQPEDSARRVGRPAALSPGDANRRTLVVGVTGASGAPYAARLVERAVRAGRRVHLVATAAGRLVMADELGLGGPADELDLAGIWPPDILAHITYTPAEDLSAPPASGSFDAEAAVIIPCSMNTLAALAAGLAGNLVQRAAYVALKEGRPLVLVPREMPVTRIDLENMARLASVGAVVMPAMPGFYHRPRSVGDIVDFVVAKVLDRLGIEHGLNVRWPVISPP